MSSLQSLYSEASSLASHYNWPQEAKQLRNGTMPEGFCREVGKTIALFLWHGPLCPQTEENRQHAKWLARLRLLLAQIRMAERKVS